MKVLVNLFCKDRNKLSSYLIRMFLLLLISFAISLIRIINSKEFILSSHFTIVLIAENSSLYILTLFVDKFLNCSNHYLRFLGKLG